jgi:putative transposase
LRNHERETLIVGGVEDYVHALFALSRNYSIIAKEIKRTSSKWIKEKSSKQKKFHWQSGYGGFFASQSHLNQVERQEENHRRVTFQDEYRIFLKKYCIDYDERYVWTNGLTNPFRVHWSKEFVTQGDALGWNWRMPSALARHVACAFSIKCLSHAPLLGYRARVNTAASTSSMTIAIFL